VAASAAAVAAIATTAAAATTVANHLLQLRVNTLLGLAQNIYEVTSLLRIVSSEEGDGGTMSTSTSCTTNPMDVILRIVGIVIVQNMGDVTNIDTTGGNVRGNHYGAFAGLKLVQDPVTLVLLLIAVNGECGPSILTKETSDIVSNTLGANENEALIRLVFHNLLEVVDHTLTLLRLINNLNGLSNAMVSREVKRTNVNLDEVVKELRGKLANLLGPGSGPHESLAVRANLADDLADLGLEAHVKHSISFIKNKVSDTTQVSLAPLKHVNQSSRSGNANLHTTRKVSNLRATGDTAVNTGVADARGSAELGHLLLNLNSKLTSRG